MAELPDGTVVLITTLEVLGTAGPDRETGAPLPSWVVRRIGGPITALADQGLYSVHAYGASDAEARRAAMQAFDQITALKPPFGGQQPVTISTGTVYVDDVQVIEGPRDVTYTPDRSIIDHCATYRVDIRRV